VRLGDLIGFAATALVRHRRRSLFSVVGMMVGVAAVVVLTALGEGAQRYVLREFTSLGTNLLIVIPGRTETSGAFPGLGGVPNDLTLDDAAALDHALSEVDVTVPVSMGNETVSHFERRRQVVVMGTTSEFLEARELVVSTGQFLPRDDMDRGAPVAVLGATVAQELFGEENPLGGVLRIGGWRMRTIGVLERQGQQIGLNIDDIVIIPVAFAMRLFDRSSLFRILLKLDLQADLEKTKSRVRDILIERHDEEDVTLITQESVRESLSKILRVLTLAVAGIGAISLTVAGLGVMNLMLVSVSERTREVGLLKALGAARSQILAMFLTEAVLLAVAGALLGIVAGFGLVRGFVAFYPSFPASPPAWALAAVILVAVLIGAVFGVLPARRATDLDAATALAGK
jgi:putative ABC transport system permease protein